MCLFENLFYVLPSVGQLYDGSRFYDIFCLSEGGPQNLYLIFSVKWFSCLMSQGIVDKKCPGRFYEGAEVKGG